MTIYADSMFAVNTLSNMLLMYSYSVFYGSKRRHIAAASAAGGVYAVIEAVLGLPHILRMIVLVGMIYVAFGKTGIVKHMTRIMLLCFAVEGITLAILSAIGAGAELARSSVVLFASEPVCAFVYLSAYPLYFAALKLKKRRSKYIHLKIKYKGRMITTVVLRDSGNLLKYHDKPVIMVAWEAAGSLFDYNNYSELKEKTDTYVIYETVSGAGIVPIVTGAECKADGISADVVIAIVERKFKGRYFGIAGEI